MWLDGLEEKSAPASENEEESADTAVDAAEGVDEVTRGSLGRSRVAARAQANGVLHRPPVR